VASGAVATSGVIQVAGRLVTMPASASFAANAGQFVVGGLRSLNPVGMVASVAAWLAVGYIVEHFSEWMVAGGTPEVIVSPTQLCYAPGYATSWLQCNGNTGPESCIASYSMPLTLNAHDVLTSFSTWNDPTCRWHRNYDGVPSVDYTYGSTRTYAHCIQGANWVSGTGCVVSAVPSWSPPTDAQWTVAGNNPLPNSAASALPGLGIYPPVESPQIIPGWYPYSSPYQLPNGDWVQPGVQVTPNPDGSVTVVPGEKPVANGDGDPLPDPQPPPVPDPNPDPCDLHPERAGCAGMDDVPDQELENKDVPVSVSSWGSWGGSGSCPAPAQASFLGRPLSFSYAPTCQFLTGVRPVVIASAWLAAALIVIGAFKESS
jgi:hypothetical protein